CSTPASCLRPSRGNSWNSRSIYTCICPHKQSEEPMRKRQKQQQAPQDPRRSRTFPRCLRREVLELDFKSPDGSVSPNPLTAKPSFCYLYQHRSDPISSKIQLYCLSNSLR